MTVSKSPGAYQDCYSAMDAAIADPIGIRLRMADEASAIYFRMRCHMARKIDRDNNALTFEPGDPLYAISAYDTVVLRIREEDGVFWLYLEQNTVIPAGVALSLSNGEEVEMSLPRALPPMRALPPPREAMNNGNLGEAFDELPVATEPKQGIRRL